MFIDALDLVRVSLFTLSLAEVSPGRLLVAMRVTSVLKRISRLVLAIALLPVLADAFDEDKNPFDTNTFQGLIGYGFHVQ